MKRRKEFGKYIFTTCFFLLLFGYSVLSVNNAKESMTETLKKTIDEYDSDNVSMNMLLSSTISELESDISKNVYARYGAIELYGSIQKLEGKTEINGFDYALDGHGGYNQVDFWNEVDDIDYKIKAQQVVKLKEYAEKYGGKMFYIQSPDKLDKNWNPGLKGIPYGDYNTKADRFVNWIKRYGIDTIDFRDSLKKSGLSYEEMFYNTDHHWTGVAAFSAFRDLVDFMNTRFDENLDPDGYYRNIENYNIEYTDNIFLGSGGRDMGYSFGNNGFEKFQLFTPKFSGNIEWYKYRGDYKDTVLRYDALEFEDPYSSDVYGFYLNGVSNTDRIVNKANEDGLRMLFIRDSFLSPVIIDMIPFCSRIDCVWGLHASDEEIKEKIKNGNYDYVVLGYGTINLADGAFNFFNDEVARNSKK